MEPMAEAILIFSLGPVQGFIAEARRVGDLDAGSAVLKRLSRAAGQAIQSNGGTLIYPARLGDENDDVPNKLVARVPGDRVKTLVQAAEKAIEGEWRKCADTACRFLTTHGPSPDECWNEIWKRQTGTFWETYWAAAPLEEDYHAAYDTAGRAFNATKRTRAFLQVEEKGVKDSLGGRRSALLTADLRAAAYWAQVASSPSVTQATLRPEGRECLDALGAIKRWGGLTEGSPSVSHIAATDFLMDAKKHSKTLDTYRCTVEALLGNHRYAVSTDPDWPYDGDLFFEEILAEGRLADSYGLNQPQPGLLETAQKTLMRMLYPAVGFKPSPYYAIIVFDGDGIGEMVSKCESEEEHRALSEALLDFASQARKLVEEHHGHAVYVGGDDVLALAPLAQALPLVQALAKRFPETVESGTASAGVVIAHHLHPLDATLSAARQAERRAKSVTDKATVCVRVLRRSGEQVDARSRWATLGDFGSLVTFIRDEALSSKLPYAVANAAYALPDPDDAFEAELRRLLKRHHNPKKWSESETEWAGRLRAWAEDLPKPPAARKGEHSSESISQTEELAHWLALARFMAQGGVE
jgi:CRISPR-associated protein Cmr2